MKLHITHTTEYMYQEPVTDSVNEIRLSPSTNFRQSCYQHQITIEPPAALYSYEDYFGNRVHSFSVQPSHSKLAIRTVSTVITHDNDRTRREVLSPDEEWAMLGSESFRDQYAEFLLPTSHYTALNPDVTAFAAAIGVEPGLHVYERVEAVAGRIYEDFEYMPHKTGVASTTETLLQHKQGVCQDFAHLMLAVCRSFGIPARYVSGYHFVGDLNVRTSDFEQASHAWVEAYIPGTGWIGFDPTNNGLVNSRYVKLGHGRDYVDIVPVKGVYRGTPNQTLQVTVDVRRIEQ